MRILILSDFFDNRGGAVVIAKALAFGLKKTGHDVSVIASTQNKTNASIIPIMEANGENEIPVYYIYSNYNLFWRAYRSLYNPQTVKHIAKIFKEVKPDIVHAHNIHIYLSYHALKLAKKSGAKVFLTAHDAMLFHYGKLVGVNYKISVWQQIKRAGKTYNPLRNLIIRHYLKYVDKIFAVSGALKDALTQNGIKNIEVIHNGINAGKWAIDEPAVNDFKNKYNLDGKKIILFGGRLSETKGGKEIVLAMSKIVKEVPGTHMLVLGKIDDYAAQLVDLATKLGMSDKLIFTGWLTGDLLKSAFNVCDIIVVPSVCFDSFPTINLEAMACKKPVIATCFGGSREAVLDGETGYIVNPLNIEELADKITYLLKNSDIAKKFGEAGHERMKKEFSLAKMTENCLSWYDKT